MYRQDLAEIGAVGRSTDTEIPSLISGRVGDLGDILSLSATKRSHITVGESGGQPTS